MYLTENWRLKRQRYNLNGSELPETKELTFPPRSVTPRDVEVYDFEAQDSHDAPMVEERDKVSS